MAKRLLAVAVVAAVWSMWVLTAVGIAATPVHFRDEFNAVSYTGNDGPDDFAWKWVESGDNGGPVGGLIWVDGSGCSGNCLKLGGDNANLGAVSITRLANTAGAEDLRLRFEYRIESEDLTSSGGVRVMASGDGGQSWGSVRYYPIATSKSQATAVSADITEFASSQMMIGFFGVGSANGYIAFDNVDIAGDIATATTTMTTSSTITTTTNPPTTSTTTTTSAPTTAPPPDRTTTTISPTTTTLPLPTTTNPPSRDTTSATTAASGFVTSTTTPGGAEAQSQADLIAAGSRYTDKEDLLTTALDTRLSEKTPPVAGISVSPIEYATTGITIAASTLRTNALAAFALGILIALLALRGLSRFDDKDSS